MRRVVALLVAGALASGTAWSGGVARPGGAPWSERIGAVLVGWVAPVEPDVPVRRGPDLTGLLLVPPEISRGTGARVSIDEVKGRLSDVRQRKGAEVERANRARFPFSADDRADRAARLKRVIQAEVP